MVYCKMRQVLFLIIMPYGGFALGGGLLGVTGTEPAWKNRLSGKH